MSLTPSQAEQEVLAETLRRDGSSMTGRQLFAALVPALLFAAGEAALLGRAAIGPVHLLPIAACMLILFVAASVRIDLPFGYTVPTQLGLVPLWFAAPPAVVPLLVMLALGTHDLLEVLRGNLRAARLITVPANAAYVIAPAAVFVAAGVPPRAASVALLIGALVAQLALDFVLSGLRQSLDRAAPFSAQLSDAWVYFVDAGLSCVAFVVARQFTHSTVAVLSLLPLLVIFRVFSGERRARFEGLLQLRDAYRGTALVLRDVVEFDDGYTGKHSQSVVVLALAVGEQVGLPPDRLRILEFGALLHDVGKIAIPKEIINKPGKLDPREWMLIKTHTLEGQRMLDRVGGSMREVGMIVRSHHERWDGHGYPDGLTGEQIPLESRIISCCDTWNAMRTDRSYRKALSYQAAMAELIASAGTQLDPSIVSVLVSVLEHHERSVAPRRSITIAPEPAINGMATASDPTPVPALDAAAAAT